MRRNEILRARVVSHMHDLLAHTAINENLGRRMRSWLSTGAEQAFACCSHKEVTNTLQQWDVSGRSIRLSMPERTHAAAGKIDVVIDLVGGSLLDVSEL